MSSVTIGRLDGVATVTVDSPPVNALSHAVLTGLETAAAELGADPDIRAVVLTGTGDRAFVAGADISEFGELLARGPDGLEDHLRWTEAIFMSWQRLPQPVIAAAQANAIGGGLELALACDLIVLDAAARVGLPEVKLGLIPGGGATQRLIPRVGSATAKRMMMLGVTLTADDALASGLVDFVAAEGQTLDEATGLAARLASMPAVAVQAVKRAVDEPRFEGLELALANERERFKETFASEDFKEGYSAFQAKRRPVYRHR